MGEHFPLKLSASKSNATFALACEVAALDIPAKLMLWRIASYPGNGRLVDAAITATSWSFSQVLEKR
jgi:hypothetical protein